MATVIARDHNRYEITGTSSSGGRVIASGYTKGSSQGAAPITLAKDDLFKYQLERNGLTATPLEFTLLIASDSNNVNVFAELQWDEVSY